MHIWQSPGVGAINLRSTQKSGTVYDGRRISYPRPISSSSVRSYACHHHLQYNNLCIPNQ